MAPTMTRTCHVKRRQEQPRVRTYRQSIKLVQSLKCAPSTFDNQFISKKEDKPTNDRGWSEQEYEESQKGKKNTGNPTITAIPHNDRTVGVDVMSVWKCQAAGEENLTERAIVLRRLFQSIADV